jgi:hypothetical protein
MPKETPKKKKTTPPVTGKRVGAQPEGTHLTNNSYGSRAFSSNLPKGNYSGNAAPRVGGPAKKSSTPPLVGASKSQMRKAKKMVRKGTGSGAKKRI